MSSSSICGAWNEVSDNHASLPVDYLSVNFDAQIAQSMESLGQRR
jgi:hypothetical protein